MNNKYHRNVENLLSKTKTFRNGGTSAIIFIAFEASVRLFTRFWTRLMHDLRSRGAAELYPTASATKWGEEPITTFAKACEFPKS